MLSYIYNGIRECHDSETLRKVIMLNIFLALGFIILLLMGVIALVQQALFLALADFILALLFFTILFYLHKTGDEPTTSRVGVGMYIPLLLLSLCSSQVSTPQHLCGSTPFLLFALYLLGLRQGIWITCCLFCFCAGFLIVDLVSDSINVYTKDFAIRFIPSYLSVCILAFLVENCRADTRDAMLDKQRLLAGTIHRAA